MTIHYHLDERGFIEIRPVGRNNLQAYITLFTDIAASEDMRNVRRYLFDAREIVVSLTSTDIARLSDNMSRQNKVLKTAVVAEQGIHFGLTRMYQSISRARELEIFDSYDDAVTWLLETP